MRKLFLAVLMTVLFLMTAAPSNFAQSTPYTPAKGSIERKAILDGVRKYRNASGELYTPTTFNVQNGWAMVSAEDPKEPGVDTAAFDVVLRQNGKRWKVVDEISHVEGSDYNKEVKRIRKKIPNCPAAIFKEN